MQTTGNDLAREMSDVFSCHHVPAMDVDSNRRILQSYGPNVNTEEINKIVNAWEELRIAHEKGTIIYPFSLREAVGVVKHLNEFPNDGIQEAVENVISFDRFDTSLVKRLNNIFLDHGISLGDRKATTEQIGHAEALSTPKTRASEPKHGKVDPENTPHVGGNTWAGKNFQWYCLVQLTIDFILLTLVLIHHHKYRRHWRQRHSWSRWAWWPIPTR